MVNPRICLTIHGLYDAHYFHLHPEFLLNAVVFPRSPQFLFSLSTREEWNGDWSDKSSKWEEHPEVAEAVGFKAEDEGQHSKTPVALLVALRKGVCCCF